MLKKRLYWLAIILLIGGFVYFGTRDYKKDVVPNINDEYNLVAKDNVFLYANSKKVLDVITSGNGIMFFGFSENTFANNYASILNEVAKANGIKEVYYYNFYNDRKNNRNNYEEIVNYLKKYLVVRDDGIINIYAPSLLVIKNNEVLYYDTEYNFMNSEIDATRYFTEEVINTKKANLDLIFKQYTR